MNYLIYPLKIMNLTQSYNEGKRHRSHYLGWPKDYPIDDNCGDSKKDGYFYCPCDEMVVKKIYGVGKPAGNTIWLESTTKVITPTFNDYVTIMVVHPDDLDFKNISVGKKYRKFRRIIKEGKDGYATGYHFHIAVGRGKMKGTGMKKNSLGTWVINTTKGGVKPEDAFWIDSQFTTVKNDRKIKFVQLNKKQKPNYYVIASSLNVRNGPGLNYKILNTLPRNTKLSVLEIKGSWSKISNHEWVSNYYLTENQPQKYYEIKHTTVSYLNVRNRPNGKKSNYKAPLIKNTTVAIMKTKDNWTQINRGRWVYSSYLS